MAISDYFTESAGVYRLTGALDAGGAQTKARALSSTITGHIYAVSSSEIALLSKYEGKTIKKFLCALTSDVIFSDVLTIAGKDYDVVGVMDRTTGDNAHKELIILLRGD